MNKENKIIVFSGPVKSRSGYGARSRDVVSALIELEDSNDFTLYIINTNWGSTPNSVNLSSSVEERILDPEEGQTFNMEDYKKLASGQNQSIGKPDIFIQCTIPAEFIPVGKQNIGLTAGIETNACHPKWIEGCNRMDLILTSSTHSKAVFEATKFPAENPQTGEKFDLELQKPCEVLIEGFDPSIYRKLTLKNQTVEPFYDDISKIPTDFNFLFVGHWLQGAMGQDRKDVAMLVRTFLTTFSKVKRKNRPGLILKTSLSGFSKNEYFEILKRIDDIKKFIIREEYPDKKITDDFFPNVYILNGDLSDDEMNTLYNHKKVKAMVSFTKGEGFGRPLLEFTTTGKPVLATNWSGHLDFLHPEYAFLIPAQFQDVHPSAQNNWIIKGSKWARANYKYAGNLMKNMTKVYDKFLEKSRKHIKHTSDNFSFIEMKNQISNYLENLETYTKKPKAVKLDTSSWKNVNLPKIDKKLKEKNG